MTLLYGLELYLKHVKRRLQIGASVSTFPSPWPSPALAQLPDPDNIDEAHQNSQWRRPIDAMKSTSPPQPALQDTPLESPPPSPSSPHVEARAKPVNCYTIFREALPVQKRNKTAYHRRAGFVTRENKRDRGRYSNVPDSILPADGEEAMQYSAAKWKRCAVVGNAGSLLANSYGKMIDAHDIVFRMNQAPIVDYEQFVGERTTHRLLNRLWTLGYSKSALITSAKYKSDENTPLEPGVVLISSRTEGDSFKDLHAHMQIRSPSTKVLKMHRTSVSMAEILLKKFRTCLKQLPTGAKTFAGGNTASSGLVSLVMLYQLCDQVSLFGVGDDSSSPRVAELPYQYYKLGGTERAAGNPVHSFDLEALLIKSIAQGGAITLCGADGCTRGGKTVNLPTKRSW
eukprot:CAMPEP_0118956982 /NCGR_PEP_ID=MMETSP1169-20130426/61861_1 /TAXON_ID=36882 /ORGANISM="Pyramimonas obovata, Strain CCMP722" /LENGTH=398 /DNA_ID=CAMNT_0006905035 /DNA_START=462 /DNA_END=1658 /DNA_ORIENTATION=-